MARVGWFLAILICSGTAFAEVTGVTIAARSVIADGREFGAAGAYEQLSGSVAFALGPADPHNSNIVDLEHAVRGDDGLVRFGHVGSPAGPYAVRRTLQSRHRPAPALTSSRVNLRRARRISPQ